jgi:hypothetical protein
MAGHPKDFGLWFAAFDRGHRQVSVSIWRTSGDLRRFVRSRDHELVMQRFRDAGSLYTTSWTVTGSDPANVWRDAEARLFGRAWTSSVLPRFGRAGRFPGRSPTSSSEWPGVRGFGSTPA